MIEIDELTIELKEFTLEKVSLNINKGEFYLILGPTGAGKTLFLEAIAGIVPITSGNIRIGGRDITNLPPEKRCVGIVYQDYALFPHMTALDNILYGIRYLSKKDRRHREKIERLMQRVGIAHLAKRRVTNLSGVRNKGLP